MPNNKCPECDYEFERYFEEILMPEIETRELKLQEFPRETIEVIK